MTADDPLVDAPTRIRVCGSELAEGRLVAVRVDHPWGTQANVNGDVCPVHDPDWPAAEGKPAGECLVDYVPARPGPKPPPDTSWIKGAPVRESMPRGLRVALAVVALAVAVMVMYVVLAVVR